MRGSGDVICNRASKSEGGRSSRLHQEQRVSTPGKPGTLSQWLAARSPRQPAGPLVPETHPTKRAAQQAHLDQPRGKRALLPGN